MANSFKVGLLGGGSWGTTVASLMTRNADVTLWARSEETAREINEAQRADDRPRLERLLEEKTALSRSLHLPASAQDDGRA